MSSINNYLSRLGWETITTFLHLPLEDCIDKVKCAHSRILSGKSSYEDLGKPMYRALSLYIDSYDIMKNTDFLDE
tara:strand:+ start:23317 stop:23541 length:225 start_codon:yes stop_codon:yes gene_type:complete